MPMSYSPGHGALQNLSIKKSAVCKIFIPYPSLSFLIFFPNNISVFFLLQQITGKFQPYRLNRDFSFVLLSLLSVCTIFETSALRYSHSEEQKKIGIFFYTSLGLHYLWRRAPKILTLGNKRKKKFFSLYFSRLIVSLYPETKTQEI